MVRYNGVSGSGWFSDTVIGCPQCREPAHMESAKYLPKNYALIQIIANYRQFMNRSVLARNRLTARGVLKIGNMAIQTIGVCDEETLRQP